MSYIYSLNQTRCVLLLLASVCPMAANAVDIPARVELTVMARAVDMAPTVAMSNLAKECGIAKMVNERVTPQVQRTYRNLSLSETLPKLNGEERGLKLSVVNMFGLGGGNYSGPKWMVIRAEVVGPDGVISARDFRRVSVASFSGLFMGTCHVMKKVASKAGADLRKWLLQGAPGTPVAVMDEDDEELLRGEQPASEPEQPDEPAAAEPPASAAST